MSDAEHFPIFGAVLSRLELRACEVQRQLGDSQRTRLLWND